MLVGILQKANEVTAKASQPTPAPTNEVLPVSISVALVAPRPTPNAPAYMAADKLTGEEVATFVHLCERKPAYRKEGVSLEALKTKWEKNARKQHPEAMRAWIKTAAAQLGVGEFSEIPEKYEGEARKIAPPKKKNA